MRKTVHNTGLAKAAVQCSASAFVVKIATFTKPETVRRDNTKNREKRNK